MAAAAAGAIATSGVATAQVQTVPTLVVSGGVGYNTNPLVASGGSGNDDRGGSGSTSINVQPSIQFIDGVDTALISGTYNRQDFFNGQRGNSGYGVNVNGHKQFDARTSLNLYAGFDSSILGGLAGFAPATVTTPVVGGTAPVGTTPIVTTPVVTTPVVPIDGDIGLIGLGQRRNAITVGADFAYQPSEVATWTAGANATRSTYPGAGLLASNYTSVGGQLGYTRSLDEVSSAGLTLSVSNTDYQRGFSTRIYTPRVTYSRRFSERFSGNIAIGAAIVDDGLSGTNVTVSALASACRSWTERGDLCINASRDPSPTGFGGVRTQTQVGATYGYRLSEVTSLSAGASYSHVGGGSNDPAFASIADQDYIAADATLSRRIGRRLSATATASYRDIGGGQFASSDLSGRLGLSVTLGGRE